MAKSKKVKAKSENDDPIYQSVLESEDWDPQTVSPSLDLNAMILRSYHDYAPSHNPMAGVPK